MDNIINLSDASVSEYHAVIQVIGHQMQIRDLGSTNGTFINANRIQGRADLNWGDDISIGPYHIELVAPTSDPDGFPMHPTDVLGTGGIK
jgi:pSer/pThr/pTyr-binding forkhead associated (FHA) protein